MLDRGLNSEPSLLARCARCNVLWIDHMKVFTPAPAATCEEFVAKDSFEGMMILAAREHGVQQHGK